MNIPKKLKNKIGLYMRLTRLNKPIGIFLLIWPALWALWLSANGRPQINILIIFILGAIIVRSAGCIINDIADRKLDRHVERTKNRPLATGEIKIYEAIILFITLSVIGLFLASLLNPLTIKIAIIAGVLTIIYPFLKRITNLPQLGLGMTFNLGVLMAYSSQTNSLPLTAWFLFVISCVWTIAYDTMYAMSDREDDIKIGIKSTAILFGAHDKLIIGLMQLNVILGLMCIGFIYNLHDIYFTCLAIAAILCIYQQLLIKNYNRAKCLKAFLNNNYFGMIVFIGIILS